MDWLGDFMYQMISGILFAVALGFMFYFLAERQQTGFFVCAFISWVAVGAMMSLYLNNRVLIEPETGGVLTPANDPDPPIPGSCGALQMPAASLRVYLGSSFAYSLAPLCRIIQVAGQPLLSVERRNGGILVSAKVFSRDKRIVAEIENNKFLINPNNYFRRDRPDRHTLIVYDQEDQEVLNVRYLNPHSVAITGRFYYPNRAPVVIQKDGLSYQTLSFRENCFGSMNANSVVIAIK